MNCTSFEKWLIERGEGQPSGNALARLELPSSAQSHLFVCAPCRQIWEDELLLDQVIPVWRERVPVAAELSTQIVVSRLGLPGLRSQQSHTTQHNAPAMSQFPSNHIANGQSTHSTQQSAHSRNRHFRAAMWGRLTAVGLVALVLMTFGRSAWLGVSTSTPVAFVPPTYPAMGSSDQSPPQDMAPPVPRGAVSSGAVDIPYSLAWAASDVHETYRQIAQETSSVLDDIVEPPALQTFASHWPVWSVSQQTGRSFLSANTTDIARSPTQIDLSQTSTSEEARALATGWAKAFDFVFEALPEGALLEES